jgi:hypothetical protein
VEAGTGGECVASPKRLAVVVGVGNRHAGPNGVAGPQEGSKVCRKGHPQRGDHQMVGARDRSSSSFVAISRATVFPAHRVRNGSFAESDRWFMRSDFSASLGRRWRVAPYRERACRSTDGRRGGVVWQLYRWIGSAGAWSGPANSGPSQCPGAR